MDTNKTLTTLIAVLTFSMGFVVQGMLYQYNVDYRITLDHNNVILKDDLGNVIYLDSIEEIPDFIKFEN